MDKKEKRKIDKYKESLYSRKYQDTTESDLEKLKRLRKKKYNLNQDWDDVELSLEEKEELYQLGSRKTNFYMIFFILAFSFFVISVGVAGFFLYFQKNEIPLNRMDVSLIAPDRVDSGEVLEYKIKIENNTDLKFKNLSLFIKYPEGSLDPDEKYKKKKEDLELKDILPGGVETITRKIILSGAPDEVKKIRFNLNYQLEGYSTILTKKKEFLVKISTAPIFVKIEAPEFVTNKKDFDIKIVVSSNSDFEQKNILLIGRYPNGFEITEEDPNPIFKTNHKNIFRINKLEVGEKQEIHLKGKMVGENGEMKVLAFIAGLGSKDNNEITVKYFDSKEKVVIKKPGLDLQLFCNDREIEKEIAIFGGTLKCNYTITNNLPSKITDVRVKMYYDDQILNEEKIRVLKGGYIDSNNNFIFWDKNNENDFLVINNGDSVSIPFEFKLKPIKALAGEVRNPEIKLNFEILGTNFDNENKLGVVDRKLEKIIRLNSDVRLVADVNYNDGPLENYGGPTPKIGQEVSYTVNWKIFNTTNKIKNVKITATLPIGIEWKDNYSPEDSYVSYNPSTRVLKWSIKSIPPFIGYRTEPKTLSFQLATVPVLADLGSYIILLKDIKVVAQDEFSGEILEYELPGVKNLIKQDEGLKFGTGKVME